MLRRYRWTARRNFDRTERLSTHMTTRATSCDRTLISGLTLALFSATALGQAPEPEKKGWQTTARLAAAVNRGNTDTVTVAGSVNTGKKWDQNELAFGAAMNYGEESDRTTSSSVSGFGQYNRLLTERLYGYARVDALHDDMASLAYRVTFSPGVGYYVIKTDKLTLSGEVGPGFVMERFHNESQEEYFTIRFGERFGWQISKTARLWQSLDYNPQVDDFGNYLLNAEVGIATRISEGFELNLTAQNTYRSRPAEGRTENDFKLLAGVGYTF